MGQISNEERAAIRDGFGRLLSEKAGEADVRKAMVTPLGYDLQLWKSMAEMGLLGLLIDPAYGGTGGDAVTLEDLMEEAGAHLLCSPFLSTSVIAASVISAANDEDQKSGLLTGIVSGDCIIAVAATGDKGLWTPQDISVQANQDGDGWKLDGSASFVLHAEGADKILVFAKNGNDIQAFLTSPDANGITIERLKTNDPSLHLSKIAFDSAKAEILAGADQFSIKQAMDLARIALAGEHAGGTKRIFDITVEYLRTRHQFGRQIGGYQSLKHIAADMLIEVESATSAARTAAEMQAGGKDDAQTLISLAAFACADAYRDVTFQAIQLHGGIAYTWEHPAHLYWRRARTGLWLFGSSDQNRENYLSQLEAA